MYIYTIKEIKLPYIPIKPERLATALGYLEAFDIFGTRGLVVILTFI